MSIIYRCPDCGDMFANINDVNGFCSKCDDHYPLDKSSKLVQVVKLRPKYGDRGDIYVKNLDEAAEMIKSFIEDVSPDDLVGDQYTITFEEMDEEEFEALEPYEW